MTRLVAGVALVVVSSTPLAAQTISVREFAARMDARAAAVRTADPGAAARLASTIPASERVAAGGDTYDIPLDSVKRALDAAPSAPAAWTAERQRLAERLEAVSSEARRLDDIPREDPSPRETLTRVLADRRFASATRVSWQRVLRDRIREWLTEMLGRTAAYGWGGRRIAQAVAWTVSIAAIAVLILWLMRVTLRRRADRPISVGSVGTIVQPAHILAAEAVELIRAGRVREGARAAYRAALRRLEEEGVVRPNAASTPRETLRLVAPAHRRAAPLAALTSVFERIWYGSRPAGQDDGLRLLGLLRDLECLPSDRAK